MTNEELNTRLYEKMFEEQETYRGWLLSQPPEEILNHTYEYTMREDILISMECDDLSDKQCRALLKSPVPSAMCTRNGRSERPVTWTTSGTRLRAAPMQLSDRTFSNHRRKGRCVPMGYVLPEDIEQAKQMDLLTYLQNYEPQELVRVSGNTFCTREHDSLKISNGKWHWFSREVGGKTALDYLIKVKGYGFVEAVETILGRAAVKPPVFYRQKVTEAREMLMPPLNDNTNTVERYLKGRGIHPVIIDYCLKNKLLFESRDYHNAVFMGYDPAGKARYGCVRGTVGIYKGDLSGSDKHYSFSIPGKSDTVHLFESAIDLMSFATLELFEGATGTKTICCPLQACIRQRGRTLCRLRWNGI